MVSVTEVRRVKELLYEVEAVWVWEEHSEGVVEEQNEGEGVGEAVIEEVCEIE